MDFVRIGADLSRIHEHQISALEPNLKPELTKIANRWKKDGNQNVFSIEVAAKDSPYCMSPLVSPLVFDFIEYQKLS